MKVIFTFTSGMGLIGEIREFLDQIRDFGL